MIFNENQIYFPMLVTKEFGKIDKVDHQVLLWQRYDSLPQKTQEILTSEKIRQFIYGASQQYNLDNTKTEEFSRTVRQYFFGEIVDGQFARKIAELCNTSNEEGLEILNSIKNIHPESEVVTRRNPVTGQAYSASKPASAINFSSNVSAVSQKPVGGRLSSTTPSVSNIVQVPIKKALKLYPKLENLSLTESQIVSKPFLKPVKPTIKNWLTVYEELMGIGKKGAIDRGNFLFHSEAAKNLLTEDRQKLAQVLKSADENSNLKIDTINGEIIFSEITSGDSRMSNDKSGNIEKKDKNNFVSSQFNKNVVATNEYKKINQSQQLNSKKVYNQDLTQNKSQSGSNTSSKQFTATQKLNNQLSGNIFFQETKNLNKQNIQSLDKNFVQFGQKSDLHQEQLKTNSNLASFNNFEPKEFNNNLNNGAENFVNNQKSVNLNNFSNNLESGKFGSGMGSNSFNSNEQETISLNDLNSSNEESVQFTSRHVLPIEKNK